MALIYAFRDEAGRWHGEPDASVERMQLAELVMDASQSDATSSGPFYGQVLTVRIAPFERGPGVDSYVVSNGRRYFTSTDVEAAFGNAPALLASYDEDGDDDWENSSDPLS